MSRNRSDLRIHFCDSTAITKLSTNPQDTASQRRIENALRICHPATAASPDWTIPIPRACNYLSCVRLFVLADPSQLQTCRSPTYYTPVLQARLSSYSVCPQAIACGSSANCFVVPLSVQYLLYTLLKIRPSMLKLLHQLIVTLTPFFCVATSKTEK